MRLPVPKSIGEALAGLAADRTRILVVALGVTWGTLGLTLLLATGVAVDLPQTKSAPLNIEQKPVSISIDEKGQIFLMDQQVAIEQLVEKLKAAAKAGADERVYVRGSKAVNYGRVAEVMSLVTGAGFKKVALVTEPERK